MKTKILVATMVVLSAGRVPAELIVDWGGNYVDGSRSMTLPTFTDNGGQRTFGYSDTVEVTPASYTAPAGKTDAIFAALQNTSTDGTARNFGAVRITNNGDNDLFYVQGNSGVGGSVEGLFFFTQGGFLNGYDSGVLSLDNLSGRLSIYQFSETASFRFAVESDSGWYLSETEQTATGLFELGSLGAENWGVWDPDTAPLSAVPGTFSTGGSTLDGVTAVGFYFSGVRGSSAPSLSVDSFQISVIPEPGSLVLMLLGCVAILPLRWRLHGMR